MEKYILARIDENEKYVCLLTYYFNNKRDAEVFLKGIKCIKPLENYDIIKLHEI